MKLKSTLILLLFQTCLFGQVKSDYKNWSKWIPIIDRNENKVQVSVDFEPNTKAIEAGFSDRGAWFNYKLLNGYNEAISGRLLYHYIGTDGVERQMNCTIYCLQPDEEYFNPLHSQTYVARIIDFKFVEFSSCSNKSKLLSYTANDSTIFKLYDEIKNQESRKQTLLASAVENDKKEIIKDNSDGTVFYHGKNEAVIKSLLSKVKGWRTNSGLHIQDGMPPQVIVNGDCQRDQYVNSAVLYSWAAESYFRIKEIEKAKEAADKVGELIRTVQQLCDNGGIHFKEGVCQTESIFPCSGSSSSQNIAGSISGNSNQQPLNPEQQAGQKTDNNSADFNKEKELFSGLLPVAAAIGTNSYETQAASISGFMDKLSEYTDNDSTSGGFLKVMMKLSAINVKMQANEMMNNYGGSSMNATNAASVNSGVSAGLAANTPANFSQMNTFQQQAYVESIVRPLASLFEGKVNANGLTEGEQKRRDKLEETIKIRNREYREKYGYTTKQFTEAIRNFDHALLDKILDSGFPADTRVGNDDLYADIDVVYIYDGKDYYLNGLQYAAEYGNDYAIKKFLQKGINIDELARAREAYTVHAIDLAIIYERYSSVKLLIENGVSLNSHSSYGRSLKLAKGYKYYDIAKLIEQHSDK